MELKADPDVAVKAVGADPNAENEEVGFVTAVDDVAH